MIIAAKIVVRKRTDLENSLYFLEVAVNEMSEIFTTEVPQPSSRPMRSMPTPPDQRSRFQALRERPSHPDEFDRPELRLSGLSRFSGFAVR
jgi:hypothetical protein